jgi:hypothetical protein
MQLLLVFLLCSLQVWQQNLQANQNCSLNSQGCGVVEDEDDMEESEEEIAIDGGPSIRGGVISGSSESALEEGRGIVGRIQATRAATTTEDMLDMEEHEIDEELVDEEEEDEQDDLDDDELDENAGQGLESGVRDELSRSDKPVAAASKVATSLTPVSCGGTTAFRLHFLGSIEVEEEGKKHRKRLKKNMVEEAVTRVKVCA